MEHTYLLLFLLGSTFVSALAQSPSAPVRHIRLQPGRCVFGFPELHCKQDISCNVDSDCERFPEFEIGFSGCVTTMKNFPSYCVGKTCFWETTCEFENNISTKNLGTLNRKLAPTIEKIVFGDSGKLQVAPEMINRLKGECDHISDYKILIQHDANWQCGDNFFDQGGKSMSPVNAIKQDIKGMFTDVTDEDLDIEFFPNQNERSNWCGFPSPLGTGFTSPTEYWNKCVMEKGGYFNTLACTGSNNQVHAVIGLAAMNPDVCYPTHAHLNEEAYWQFGGTGTWKAWTHRTGGSQALQDPDKHLNFDTHQRASLDTYKDYGDNMEVYPATTRVDYKAPLPNGQQFLIRHDHPAGIVHEMSTTPSEHMVMVYWWAQNYDVVEQSKQKYHFAHYATDSCSLGRIQQVQLSTGHIVPDDLAATQCSVTQKVLTGISCQLRSNIPKTWQYTRYGGQGGQLGGHSIEGRLFELQCDHEGCKDSNGQDMEWWITCGYSWKKTDDLTDNDQVIVDVKSETYEVKATNNRPNGACDPSWTKAVAASQQQSWENNNSQGQTLKWAFQLCYNQEPWSNVKKSGHDVVTDLTARTSTSVAGVTWTDVGHGGCTGGTWIYLGTATSLQQAKQLMLNHHECSKDGSMLFYSVSIYDQPRAVRCTTREHVAMCPQKNALWQEYILTQNDGYKRVGEWNKYGSSLHSKAYGDNNRITDWDWILVFSKKQSFSSTGGPLVAGRRKLTTSRLLSNTN